ncbi:MAG: hypothetical protein F6K48_03425 [Okeania sp. SIO3H1]|nr:hypothetical protein [Okeania sp. SIO3H1]
MKSNQVKITLQEACEIISQKTGEKVTPQTHYIKASVEITRDCPPYSFVTLEAIKRQ